MNTDLYLETSAGWQLRSVLSTTIRQRWHQATFREFQQLRSEAPRIVNVMRRWSKTFAYEHHIMMHDLDLLSHNSEWEVFASIEIRDEGQVCPTVRSF